MERRILDRIEVGDCWEWTGAKIEGYGTVSVGGRMKRVHRFVYESIVGPIPDGLTVDHLCRNRACSNPDHMELVSNRVNVLRGNGHSALNARRESCVNGHPLEGENLRVDHEGKRRCRECARQRSRRSYRRSRQ